MSTDAIWACTSCGACMQACPVFIEHVPKLIGMRRHLVMEKAEFPPRADRASSTTSSSGSIRGALPRASGPNGPRTTTSRCWPTTCAWNTCSSSAAPAPFDSRNRQTSLALAKIFNAAGLSWGILGTAEKCCGDPLRRLGNEYVFDHLARDNVATVQASTASARSSPSARIASTR